MQLEIAAERDRVEDLAVQGRFLERPHGADGKDRRRLSVAEAKRVPIELVEAPREGLLARECDRQQDRDQRCMFLQSAADPRGRGFQRNRERSDRENGDDAHLQCRQRSKENDHGELEE